MANPMKPVGRLDFVLRLLLISAAAFALEGILRGDALFHLTLLPHYLHAFERVIVFGIVGIYLLKAIDGRLLDTGLSRWYRYPSLGVWLLSTSLPIIWSHTWPIGLVLFALLLLSGGLVPGKSVQAKHASVDRIEKDDEKASVVKKKFPARLLVGPVGFLRTLLTFGCLWVPLIWLADTSGSGVGVWIARCGYFVLGLVWLIKVSGRLEDAGLSPKAHHGYFLIGLVILIRMLRRIYGAGWSSQPSGFPFSSAANIALMLPSWSKLINGYEILALFLVIQIPLALLPSKPMFGEPHSQNSGKEGSKRHTPAVKTNDLALSGPFEYLRILFVIACLYIPLIYLDDASGGSAGSWIARVGYFILGFFWLTFANGRLEDAGWAHSWYPSQYFLVVSVASLMPLAVHWVNGYEALAIFALIQTPTVLLRSKPKPEEPLMESDEQVVCAAGGPGLTNPK